MKEKFSKKIVKIIMDIIAVFVIAFFAYSLTPKTFQNDTYYTIKIGEHLQSTVGSIDGYLPWNSKIDMKDPFSIHKDLPYTYPHWLYDLMTYKIYCINGLTSVYAATCILAVILGLVIYCINRRLNKNIIISMIITFGTLFCLRNFITARAQLVTFILFALTFYGIEKFIATKKIRYPVLLVLISILIVNLHIAVWPFYFVLYLPYIAEYFITTVAMANYSILGKKIKLKLHRKKLSKEQYNKEIEEVKKLQEEHEKHAEEKLKGTYKLEVVKEKSSKWLIVIAIICLFTGLLTPAKFTPYTYTLLTIKGSSMHVISEHLPLVLINNIDMMVILVVVLGILMFTKSKIRMKDFFMLLGLIFLSFMSQRQVSMLVLIGNFILAKMLCGLGNKIESKMWKRSNEKLIFGLILTSMIAIIMLLVSMDNSLTKKNHVFVDESSYPVGAADYLINNVIPEFGEENIRIYNDYNYGSYLLYRGIPVFIDSRADLYLPEFNGSKNENGNFEGRDIMTDFLDISGIACSYEVKFDEYKITHLVIQTNSKLNSLVSKDRKYKKLYSDDYFVIYERGR